jgi:hypothetical protein
VIGCIPHATLPYLSEATTVSIILPQLIGKTLVFLNEIEPLGEGSKRLALITSFPACIPFNENDF